MQRLLPFLLSLWFLLLLLACHNHNVSALDVPEFELSFGNRTSADDEAVSIIATNQGNGGYVFAGDFTAQDGQKIYGYIAKIDGNGVEVWGRSIRNPTYEDVELHLVEEIPTGGYIGCGKWVSGADTHIFLIKVRDSDGSTVWAYHYPSAATNNEYVTSCAALKNGGFAVSAYTVDTVHGSRQAVVLLRVDESGQEIFCKYYHSNSVDDLSAQTVIESNTTLYSPTFVVAGGWTSSKAMLMKVNGTGNVYWAKKYDSSAHWFRFFNMIEVSPRNGGGYLMTGDTNWVSIGNSGVLIAHTNDNGVLKWARTVRHTKFPMTRSRSIVESTQENMFLLVGDDSDYATWVIGIDSNTSLDGSNEPGAPQRASYFRKSSLEGGTQGTDIVESRDGLGYVIVAHGYHTLFNITGTDPAGTVVYKFQWDLATIDSMQCMLNHTTNFTNDPFYLSNRRSPMASQALSAVAVDDSRTLDNLTDYVVNQDLRDRTTKDSKYGTRGIRYEYNCIPPTPSPSPSVSQSASQTATQTATSTASPSSSVSPSMSPSMSPEDDGPDASGPCLDMPCGNGGLCIEPPGKQEQGVYRCDCKGTGFVGFNCTTSPCRKDSQCGDIGTCSKATKECECPDDHMLHLGRICRKCSEGLICRGNHTVVTKIGYYRLPAPDSHIALECPTPDACPGGWNAIKVCAVGYRGRSCSSCQDGYYKDGRLCFSCSGSEHYIRFLLFVQALFVLVISVSAALLSAKILLKLTSVLRLLQILVLLCQIGSQNFPQAQELSGFFSFLSVLNWDVEMVRPGCEIPAFSFVDLFWYMIIVLIIVVLLSAILVGIRSQFNAAISNCTKLTLTKRAIKPRLLLVCVVVLEITMLRVMYTSFAVLLCIENGGDIVMNMERSTTCFEGTHVVAFPFALLAALGVVFGYPLAVYRFVRNTLSATWNGDDPYELMLSMSEKGVAAEEASTVNADLHALAHFYCKGYRSKKSIYRLVPYAVRATLMLAAVTMQSAYFACAAMSFVFTLELVVVVSGMPFDSRKKYIRTFVTRTAIFGLQFLWLMIIATEAERNAALELLLIMSCVMFVLVVIAILYKLDFVKVFVGVCKEKCGSLEKEKEAAKKRLSLQPNAAGKLQGQGADNAGGGDAFARVEALERQLREALLLVTPLVQATQEQQQQQQDNQEATDAQDNKYQDARKENTDEGKESDKQPIPMVALQTSQPQPDAEVEPTTTTTTTAAAADDDNNQPEAEQQQQQQAEQEEEEVQPAVGLVANAAAEHSSSQKQDQDEEDNDVIVPSMERRSSTTD